MSGDKGKDDKKRKDKKPGVLSQWFKRKDKKNKSTDDDGDEPEKSSGEFTSLSPQHSLDRGSSPEVQAHKPAVLQKSFSKQLQQHQQQQYSERSVSSKQAVQQEQRPSAPDSTPNTEASVSSTGKESIRDVLSPVTAASAASYEVADAPKSAAESGQRSLPSPVSGISQQKPLGPTAGRTTPPSSQTGKVQQSAPILERSMPGAFRPKVDTFHVQQTAEESPIDVSPLLAPNSVEDSSSRSVSTISPPISPMVQKDAFGAEAPVSAREDSGDMTAWSDSCLRSYLDDGSDVRDLFIIVHDKTNVRPAGPDHPISGSLFKEESRRLKELTGQLDGMLLGWMNRTRRGAP